MGNQQARAQVLLSIFDNGWEVLAWVNGACREGETTIQPEAHESLQLGLSKGGSREPLHDYPPKEQRQ